MGEDKLTYEEFREVIKLLDKTLDDALKEQARIQMGYVLQNIKE